MDKEIKKDFKFEVISSHELEIKKEVYERGCVPIAREISVFSEKRQRDDNWIIDQRFITRNFDKASNYLKAGVKYELAFVKIIGGGASSDDCLAYMKKNGYSPYGPALLPIIKKYPGKIIPKNVWLVSFDAPEFAFKSHNERMIPCMKIYDRGGEVQFALYDTPFDYHYVLCCLKKI